MNTEVSSSESTGEPINASAARGPSPTLVVRRPDAEGRPEVPVMLLRSHSRGGRSSACAQETFSQAGSQPIENVNFGGRPTRQGKSRPETEIHYDHTSPLTDPISVGTGLKPQPSGSNPTDTPEVHTGPTPVFTTTSVPAKVNTGPHKVNTLGKY